MMNKWLEWCHEIFLSLAVGSVAIAFVLLIFTILRRIYTHPLSVLFFLALLTCTIGIGYIIRYYALKKYGGS